MRMTAWLAARLLPLMLACSALCGAHAAPLTVNAGNSAVFNFELRATRELPVPPYTGVTFMSGAAAAPDAPNTATRARWQLWSAPDASGTLLAEGDQQLQQHDLFDNAVRYGVFSVRLTVTQGSLTVDPRAAAFRSMPREIGTLFGPAVEPHAVRVTTAKR